VASGGQGECHSNGGLPRSLPTEFQATNDADYLVNRPPAFAQLPPERVVADALRAADRGRAWVVPGGPHVRFALGSSRFVPTPLARPAYGGQRRDYRDRYRAMATSLGLRDQIPMPRTGCRPRSPSSTGR
jgi:hypothetical protein